MPKPVVSKNDPNTNNTLMQMGYVVSYRSKPTETIDLSRGAPAEMYELSSSSNCDDLINLLECHGTKKSQQV